MTVVAYVGPDATDHAVERRVRSLQATGATVHSFTFRRSRYSDDFQPDWPNEDLGPVADGSYLARAGALARAVRRLWVRRGVFRAADVVYARNLDSAVLAWVGACLARARQTPFVYEVLDVRPALSRPGARGSLARRLERAVLRRSAALVVSSPAFATEYFEPTQGFRGRWRVVENRLMPAPSLAPRPDGLATDATATRGTLRIGWFGTLRCRRSLDLLGGVARARPHVALVLAGRSSRLGDDQVAAALAGLDNVQLCGPFRSPGDLGELYGSVDLSWAIDLADRPGNSDWLLPNRLYEAGYFCVPSITLQGQHSDWLAQTRGWSMSMVEASLDALCQVIDDAPATVPALRRHLAAEPASAFLDDHLPVRRLLEELP